MTTKVTDGQPLSEPLETTKIDIKRAFLVPLALILLLMSSLLLWQEQLRIDREIHQHDARLQLVVRTLLASGISENADTLGATLDALRTDKLLRGALDRRDRGALQRRAVPLFAKLRARYGITHWYFIGPNRKVLLRVHQPERFGDTIDRHTILDAERTGESAYGIELGPLGTFTLRYVQPWFDEDGSHRLAGYVELGIDINHILRGIRRLTGAQIYLLLDKGLLKRRDWEEGMRMLGREPDWDQLPDEVVNTQSDLYLDPPLTAALRAVPPGATATAKEIETPFSVQRVLFLPLRDVADKLVGRIAVVADVSRDVAAARDSLYAGLGIAGSASATLLILFYVLLRGVERRLQFAELSLRQLATHDPLTGVYNLRGFYRLLADEMARSNRNGRSLGLLMLDLDHFKQVNDRFGHPFGDRVLQHLCEILREQTRIIDRVCRYGGEEFVIILPDTDTESARASAERLREAVRAAVFEQPDGTPLTITVSIGVALYPNHASAEPDLVAAADEAMYAAKQQGRDRVVAYRPTSAQQV